MNELSKYVWHDTVLTEIVIDRSDPGHRDTVRLSVRWPEWEPKPEFPSAVVEFSGCYLLEMNMNFGVIAQESISELTLESENPVIADLERKFDVEGLHAATFEFSSTGSLIRIVAQAVTIIPVRTIFSEGVEAEATRENIKA